MDTSTKCPNCGSEDARIVLRPKAYGRGDDLLVIEDVPVISCRTCGQNFVDAAAARAIDHVLRNRQEAAARRPVAVASLATAGTAV